MFHAVSAFNNAGFALFADSLMRFADDPWICLPIAVAVIAGGLGFPVLFELRRELRRPRAWSLHTKLTVDHDRRPAGRRHACSSRPGSGATPGTLGALDAPRHDCWPGSSTRSCRAPPASTASTSAELRDGTLLGTDVLMFIGGGSAGTAGGIKVTTFACCSS